MMSSSRSRRAAAAVALSALVAVVPACGSDPDRELQVEISDLGEDLDRVRTRLEVLEATRTETGDKLDKSVRNLRSTLTQLRIALREIRAEVGNGADAAAAAAAAAREVERDLAVLVKRYDYHLRRYHDAGS